MSTGNKIFNWSVKIILIIIFSFLITQFLFFSNTAIAGNEINFWNIGLFYLSLLWTSVFMLIFYEKIKVLNFSSKSIFNIVISFLISFIFGLLLAIDNYSWFNDDIALSLFLTIVISALIVYLYVLLSFKIYSLKYIAIPEINKYQSIVISLYARIFFLSWTHINNLVLINEDEVDLNKKINLIVTRDFIYVINILDSGNNTISFAKDKEGDLNKQISAKYDQMENYVKKIDLDNGDKIVVNLLLKKTNNDSPIIYGNMPKNFVISSIGKISKDISRYEKSSDNKGLFEEREYFISSIKEDCNNID